MYNANTNLSKVTDGMSFHHNNIFVLQQIHTYSNCNTAEARCCAARSEASFEKTNSEMV